MSLSFIIKSNPIRKLANFTKNNNNNKIINNRHYNNPMTNNNLTRTPKDNDLYPMMKEYQPITKVFPVLADCLNTVY